MTNVTDEDRNYMKNLLGILNGSPSTPTPKKKVAEQTQAVELAGPGVPTQADISAMDKVLKSLKNVVNDVVYEPEPDLQLRQALVETRNEKGIRVGNWQIERHQDTARLAGKNYYSIYHGETGNTIASDISLYETALKVARLLNSGEYVNSLKVRELFEQDDAYTSHRIDAQRFYIRSRKTTNSQQKDLYEARMQASRDRALQVRNDLKRGLDL